MEKEIYTPSRFSTLREVWRFKSNHNHHIPQNHHYNMVAQRGCSKKTLRKYLQCGHRLQKDALLKFAQTCDVEDLPLLYISLTAETDNVRAVLVKRFDLKTLFKSDITLPFKLVRDFSTADKSKLIQKYLEQIYFDDDDRIELLKMNNKALTTAFLKASLRLPPAADKMLLAYDDDVLGIYFEHCQQSKAIRKDVICNRSAALFRKMLLTREPFSLEEFQLLADGGDLAKLALYTELCSVSEDGIAYICEHASDDVFEHFIKSGAFPVSSAAEFTRLLEPKYRPLLIEYIHKFDVFSAKAEIKLLQSNDDELIETYLKKLDRSLCDETIGWIFANGLQDKYNISVDDLPTCNWQIETAIFTSGNAALIDRYLFAGEAYRDELTEFGEAQLFLHAPLDILDRYMESNSVCNLTEKAIIARWDEALFSLFFDKHNFDFNDKNTVAYLAKAGTATALDHIGRMENPDNFLCDYPEVLINLCERKDKAVYEFILDNKFMLSEEECVAFIKNAPAELVYQLLEQGEELDSKAEEALLRHPDKELVKFYLKNNELYSENEEVLLALFDPELIITYGIDNIDDDLC